MYAIIKTGGKQYRVTEGQTLRVEKLEGEPGTAVTLDRVLLIGGGESTTRIGQPFLDGVKVEAEISAQAKAKKIIIFKKKRRKGYHLKQGHRQRYTELSIKSITA